MTSTGRTSGIIMIVVGIVLFVAVTIFMLSGLGSAGTSGAILGIVLCGLLPFLLFGGVGAFMLSRGRAEERELAEIRKKERLLGLIQSQGQASLNTIIVELKMTRDEVKQAIYELVNQGLFAGYINWSTLTFYSQDASQVGSNKCPNCGGVRELVGKGVVACPYCGVELFIPANAPQTHATPTPPATPAATN